MFQQQSDPDAQMHGRGPAAGRVGASPQLNKIESVRLLGDSTRATQRCLLTTHCCSRSSGRPIEDYLPSRTVYRRRSQDF